MCRGVANGESVSLLPSRFAYAQAESTTFATRRPFTSTFTSKVTAKVYNEQQQNKKNT
jgi:hypothetical protein